MKYLAWVLFLLGLPALAQVAQPVVSLTSTAPAFCGTDALYALTTTTPWTLYGPTVGYACQALGTGTGSGTVTSVALKSATPNLFSGTAGAAVTTSGFLDPDAQLIAQAAHCVIAGPASGANAVPNCRALVSGDIPNNAANTTGTAGGLSSYPTLCTGGQFSQGLSSGSNNCGSPSGAGTVTAFSAGNLSPLFTTSVATSTSTPALTFTLSIAAQNSVFAGPATGGTAAPSFQTAPTISAANMTSFPTFNQNTTGTAANLSGTPALPNGTTATTQTAGDTTADLATDAFVSTAVSNAVAGVSKGSCVEAWSGSGTSSALTSGDDAISNNTCYNDSGVTRTITAIKCRNDNASNTTTVNPTFGASGTGTTILSGALTCGSSYAYSATGSVTNASWGTGTGIDPGMATSSLTGTSIAVIVEYTF